MTVITERLFAVTTGAQLWIGARGNRVTDMEIAAMNIGHVVGELSYLIGKTCRMTIEAVALLMATGTVNGLILGNRPVTQGPGRTVTFKTWKSDSVNHLCVMAFQTDVFVGDNVTGIFYVTDETRLPFEVT